MDNAPRLLVTGFQRFGFRTTNASEQIVRRLEARHDAAAAFEVLPVSSRSDHVLATVLERVSPAGVLLMGEQLVQGPGSVRIEPFAIDAALWNLFALLAPAKLFSPFAQKLLGDAPPASGIQVQQCNRCYLRALQWAAARGGCPVVFVHVPVFGDRDEHLRQVQAVLAALQREAGG